MQVLRGQIFMTVFCFHASTEALLSTRADRVMH